jgi:hypothetical protein
MVDQLSTFALEVERVSTEVSWGVLDGGIRADGDVGRFERSTRRPGARPWRRGLLVPGDRRRQPHGR